jgi:hypothetical protein
MITGVGFRHIRKILTHTGPSTQRATERIYWNVVEMMDTLQSFLEVDDGGGHETEQKY